MNANEWQQVKEKLMDYADLYQPMLKKQFAGLGPDMHSMDTETFVHWFDMKAQEDPQWPIMMITRFPTEWNRYLRGKVGVETGGMNGRQ